MVAHRAAPSIRGCNRQRGCQNFAHRDKQVLNRGRHGTTERSKKIFVTIERQKELKMHLTPSNQAVHILKCNYKMAILIPRIIRRSAGSNGLSRHPIFIGKDSKVSTIPRTIINNVDCTFPKWVCLNNGHCGPASASLPSTNRGRWTWQLSHQAWL